MSLPSLPALPTGFDDSQPQPGLAHEPPWIEDETFVVSISLPNEDNQGNQEDGEGRPEGASKKRAPKTKAELQASLAERDPYKLLELDQRWRSSADDIKKAHRRAVLKHHPDKQAAIEGAITADEGAGEDKTDGADDDGDEMFKAITEAFELLSDPKRRRDFDSLDEFDDSLPPKDFSADVHGDFFEVFGPVFERNSRWSEVPNTPLLGDAGTTFNDVATFYNFWFEFKSWRDFADADEYDLDDAHFREEKRWMERNNEKLRAKRRKEEKARLTKLVELAYSHDPRVLAEKEKAEAAERKKAKEKLAKAARKARARLRSLVAASETAAGEGALLEEHEIELLFARLSTEPLDALCVQIEVALADGGGGRPAAKTLLQAAVAEQMSAAERQVAAAAKAKAAERSAAQAAGASAKAPWTDDELSLLVKAANKFPGGVPDRWERMAEFINHFASPCHERTADEITGKVKERRRELEVKRSAAAAELTARGAGVPTPPPPAASTPPKPAAVAAAPNPAATAPEPPSAKPAASSEAAAAVASEWSPEQQKALEAALQKIPASVGAERWDRISENVPGKTKSECVKRYKEIVAALKAKKLAAAS